jgi:TATA-box binding protein (TBP) (component of TFIID and TFIIIB)
MSLQHSFSDAQNADTHSENTAKHRSCEILLKIKEKGIHIQNVVASASLKHGINVDAIFTALPHVEY